MANVKIWIHQVLVQNAPQITRPAVPAPFPAAQRVSAKMGTAFVRTAVLNATALVAEKVRNARAALAVPKTKSAVLTVVTTDAAMTALVVRQRQRRIHARKIVKL